MLAPKVGSLDFGGVGDEVVMTVHYPGVKTDMKPPMPAKKSPITVRHPCRSGTGGGSDVVSQRGPEGPEPSFSVTLPPLMWDDDNVYNCPHVEIEMVGCSEPRWHKPAGQRANGQRRHYR